MTAPDQPGAGVNGNYFLPANRPNGATGGLSEFASADQAYWDDYAYNQFNPKFAGMGEPVDVLRLLVHAVTANLAAVIGGMFENWFEGESVGDPAEPGYVVAAIKDAIINGYTVETKISSGTWTRPASLSACVVIGIGGGRTGEAGSNTLSGPGGKGGPGGGYVAQVLNPEDIPETVDYVVGQADQATSFGDLLVVDGGAGGIATEFGFTPTNSTPGRGGDGGTGSPGAQTGGTAGKPGESTALATGGAGGDGATGNGNGFHGQAGGSVSAGALTKCGGAGGGGGGGGGTAPLAGTRTGGTGGPGGYPGGGSGGGGGRGHEALGGTSRPGASNVPAPGILFIFTK